MEEFKDVFQEFDIDGDGTISVQVAHCPLFVIFGCTLSLICHLVKLGFLLGGKCPCGMIWYYLETFTSSCFGELVNW